MSVLYRFLFLLIISQLGIATAIAASHTHHHYAPQQHPTAISKTTKTKMQSLAAIA